MAGRSRPRAFLDGAFAAGAALVLASQSVTRISVLDGIQARADSALHIRGFLPGGGRIVMHGNVRVRRRGIGEFRVWHISLNGISIPVAQYSGPAGGQADPTADSPRFRFELPGYVRAIRLTGGRAFVLDDGEQLARRLHKDVTVSALDDASLAELRALLEEHATRTKSPQAFRLLGDTKLRARFVVVEPKAASAVRASASAPLKVVA